MTMTRYCLACIAAGLLCACATKPKEPPPKPFAGTRWLVTLELPLPGEAPSFRFGDGLMEGFGGCNRGAARYVQDSVGARAIAIGRIETGRHACDPRAQASELRILEVLQSVSSYSVTGDTMSMTGSGGTLRFKAASTAGPSTSLAGTRWTGVVDGSPDPRTVPRLEFREGLLSGFTGCNMMSGTWSMEGEAVRVGPIAVTKRMCAGPEGELEKRVLAALRGATLRREGDHLVATSPSGERFEFREAAAS